MVSWLDSSQYVAGRGPFCEAKWEEFLRHGSVPQSGMEYLTAPERYEKWIYMLEMF